MEPTDKEVNKKLAEYMGHTIDPISNSVWLGGMNFEKLYTESLDSQMSIMEELQWSLKIEYLPYNGCIFFFENNKRGYKHKEIHYSCLCVGELKKALAYALYYAILEEEK